MTQNVQIIEAYIKRYIKYINEKKKKQALLIENERLHSLVMCLNLSLLNTTYSEKIVP